ncbi:MAG: EAL domain-containing protein [Campylobacterales bacterium]
MSARITLPAHASLLESLELLEGQNTLLMISLEHLRTYACVQGFGFAETLIQKAGDRLAALKPRTLSLFYLSEGLYALLIPGDRPDYALELCDTFQAAFKELPLEVEGRELFAALSASVATGAGFGVVSKALASLEEGRKGGVGHTRLHTPECGALARNSHNLGWMDRVREALEQDAVVPYFQPLRHNASGEIAQYECLARLQSDETTYLPQTFMEAARLSGLLPTLTYMIFEKSLSRFRGTKLGLSLNLSAEDLRNEAFCGWLLERCRRHEVAPSRVTLELSETIAPGELSVLKSAVLELKGAGFRLSLDDFGVQNANFERLIELEFDSIKIDGRFVRHLDKDPKSRRLIETVVKLSSALGSVTVAEYVHNETVQKIVCDLGVDYSQGYFIGRPAATPQMAR